jgi:hypothetical protein
LLRKYWARIEKGVEYLAGKEFESGLQMFNRKVRRKMFTSKGEKNFNLCRLFLLVLWLTLFNSTWHVPEAHATTCEAKFTSLEDRFRDSSFVFTGVAEKQGRSLIPFKLTEVYKTPKGGMPKNAQILVKGIGMFFEKGKEYLIFGGDARVSGSVVSVFAYPCGNARYTAATYLQELRNKSYKSRIADDGLVTFVGRVRKREIVKNPLDGTPTENSIVTFRITELIKSSDLSPESKLPFKDNDLIAVFMEGCDDAYQPKHQYLVRAVRKWIAGTGESFTAECKSTGYIEINEHVVLKALGKKF